MHRAARLSLACVPLVSTALSLACDAQLPTSDDPAAAAATATAEVEVRTAALTNIVSAKELFVTSRTVVADRRLVDYKPGRFNADEEGAWSFGRMIDNLHAVERPSDAQRSTFVIEWLRTWERPQTVNGLQLRPRPAVRQVVIDPWKQKSIGKLGNTAASCRPGPESDTTCKLSFAPSDVPFELIAVVNRPDLRVTGTDPQSGAAAQGRFIFTLVDAERSPLPFTVIFEFMVPTRDNADTKAYAEGWHRLGAIPFGPDFNRELLNLTRRFARWHAAPWRQNGSALLQLRTNEVMLAPPQSDPANPFGGGLWELREWVLGTNGRLTAATVKQEPRQDLSGTPRLGKWAAENAAALLAGTATLPDRYDGQPFLAPAAPAPFEFVWDVPGVSDEVAHALALGTCNGCHVNETGTTFLHAFPPKKGAEAQLSPFLAGELAPDGARVADFRTLLASDPVLMRDGPGRDRGNRPPRP